MPGHLCPSTCSSLPFPDLNSHSQWESEQHTRKPHLSQQSIVGTECTAVSWHKGRYATCFHNSSINGSRGTPNLSEVHNRRQQGEQSSLVTFVSELSVSKHQSVAQSSPSISMSTLSHCTRQKRQLLKIMKADSGKERVPRLFLTFSNIFMFIIKCFLCMTASRTLLAYV